MQTHLPTSAELKIRDDQRGSSGSGSSAASLLLAFIALAGGLLGLLFSSQATFGVAILAFSVLIAVLARMIQAGGHHADLVRQLRR